MPATISLTKNASVRMIDVNEDNLACAFLANLTIPIFSLENSSVVRRFEVANQIAGIHFSEKKKNVFYAFDDSFGLHAFDTRTNAKQKFRLNPQSENRTVVATALSSDGETFAVASAEIGGGFLDVRKSRHCVIHPHVISLYDARKLGKPTASYYKRFKSDVTDMEFYSNGHDLLIGDQSGLIQVFDTTLHDEDNAFRWDRYTKNPILKVGIINENNVYTISNKSEVCVFDDSKGNVEVLYGDVSETSNQSIEKVSQAIFKPTEWCAGLVKGVDDNLPVVAVHGVYSENFISLTPINKNGIRDAKPILSYNGHVGQVKCMKATPELLLTGGEDGNVVVQIANFRNPKFGEDTIDHHRFTIKRGDLAELEEQRNADIFMVSHDSDEVHRSNKPTTSVVINIPSTSLHSSPFPPAKKIKLGKSDGKEVEPLEELRRHGKTNQVEKETAIKEEKVKRSRRKRCAKKPVMFGEGAKREAKEQRKADRKKQAEEAEKEVAARKRKAPIRDEQHIAEAKDSSESAESDCEPKVSLEGYDSDFDVFDSENQVFDFDVSTYIRPLDQTMMDFSFLEKWITETRARVRCLMLAFFHGQALISINHKINTLKSMASVIQGKGQIMKHLSDHVARMSEAGIHGSIELLTRQKQLMSNFSSLETTVCNHMVQLNEAKAKILQNAQTEQTLDELVEIIKETATLKEKKVAEKAKEIQMAQEKQLLDNERKACKPARDGFKVLKRVLKPNQQSGNKRNKDSNAEGRNMPANIAKHSKLE